MGLGLVFKSPMKIHPLPSAHLIFEYLGLILSYGSCCQHSANTDPRKWLRWLTHLLGFLLPVWKTWIEFPAPGIGSAHISLLWEFVG